MDCKPSSVQALREVYWDRLTSCLRVLYRNALSSHPSSNTVTRAVMQPTREQVRASTCCVPLFGLAPGGVYHAAGVTASCGAPLPHRFALTASARTLRHGGGMFSVALFLPSGRPALQLAGALARRCSDFPLPNNAINTMGSGCSSASPAYHSNTSNKCTTRYLTRGITCVPTFSASASRPSHRRQ